MLAVTAEQRRGRRLGPRLGPRLGLRAPCRAIHQQASNSAINALLGVMMSTTVAAGRAKGSQVRRSPSPLPSERTTHCLPKIEGPNKGMEAGRDTSPLALRRLLHPPPPSRLSPYWFAPLKLAAPRGGRGSLLPIVCLLAARQPQPCTLP